MKPSPFKPLTGPPYLTVLEAANRLRMSDEGVYRLLRRRALPFVRPSPRKTLIPESALSCYEATMTRRSVWG